MAKRKSVRGRAKKKVAKKKPASAVAKKAPRKATRKAGSKKKTTKARATARRPRRAAASVRKATAPKSRLGVITHTELASADPVATRTWCESVLGWQFGPTMPTPTGPYHMWRFDNATGGGIRSHNPPEVPGSIPYCEVEDIQATYSLALAAGAGEMMPPEAIPGGMGWIAIVAAPGGVAIGFFSKS